ncbi:MAG TPA: glycine zipper 2TM domain-containing protein [Stellaceae bacterium]|nr:glycine zipper 2TM domain-containing protein [Stellaceae bacterium]
MTRHRHRSWGGRLGAALLAASLALSFSAVPASADPPPWAPAHGWRAKHHHGDDDDDVRVEAAPLYVMPYGLAQRTCYRDVIGAALGGAAGGLVGSHIGHGSGRTAATVGGVLVGILVGGSIGRAMDEVDQACVGQVLERVPDRETIVWQNPGGGDYWVTPMRTYEASAGRYCREYETRALIGGRRQTVLGTACREPDGAWRIIR